MEAVEKDQLEIVQNPDRYLNKIQDENKIIRRDGMKTLFKEVQRLIEGETGKEQVRNICESFIRPITLLIKDPMERTRELAYEMLGIFIWKLPKTKVKEILPILIPIMVERLGQPELNEPSEEVRVLAIKRIQDLIKFLDKEMNPFIDDILHILSSGITDPFHVIRILSCEVTCEVADICRTVFHYNSDRLLRPLCLSISHQHFRVRIAVLNCIQQVVLLGNHKGIETVLPHVTQRVFDLAVGVRYAVTQAIGAWMVDYIDRYSYFSKLFPVLMVVQSDEAPNVAKKALELWKIAGRKYLEENIEMYREQVDFPTPCPSHYPNFLTRPDLGCRLLTWQTVFHILPALDNEITDWIRTTRIKSSQLLYHVILNSEEKIIMHVDKIFSIIYKALRDDELEVVRYAEKCAEMLGYFVPLSLTWPILSSTILLGTTIGNLSVLKLILRGTEENILNGFVSQVLDILFESDVFESRNRRRLLVILDICEILMLSVPKEVTQNEASCKMFRILITVWAQLDKESVERGRNLMEIFGKIHHMNLNEVMGQYSYDVLKGMKEKSSEWTPATIDRLIFEVILSNGGLGVDKNMDTILEIMMTNLNPDKDSDVRLKFFSMLAKHLVSYSKTTKIQKDQLQVFVKHVIEDVLDPNLVWKAGKTASVLRTAALSCILAILDGDILGGSTIVSMASKMVTSLVGVVEDSMEMTRFLTCECFEKLVKQGNGSLEGDILHKIYPVMLKRLDDVSDSVRIAAMKSIEAVFTNLPSCYDVKECCGYIEHVYTTLILHLDDSDEEIQDKVQHVLDKIGNLRPDILVGECEKMKMKHRSPSRCEELIVKFKGIEISNDLLELK